jgi:alpha-tubulin suppressor-like RCC1 family protein
MGTSLGSSDFAQVSLGLHHMVVLTWENEVLTCGSWVANLLGTDDRANLKQLKRLKQFEALRKAHPENPIISIGCGDRHTVALHQDGACESFGGTLYGKLGHRSSGADDGLSGDGSAPGAYTSIAGLQGQRVSQMDAGNWHTACCTLDGGVYTFGGGGRFYNHGQLGHGDTEDTMLPRRIERFGSLPASRVRVAAICCGGYHTLALTQERLVYAWGSSKFGQLGLGSDNDETTPQLVSGLLSGEGGGDGEGASGRTIGLAAGENHSLAVQADGSLYSWGFGLQGQCGHGLSQNEQAPRRVAFFAQRNICILQVDAGWRHSIVLSDTHSVYTFGHG